MTVSFADCDMTLFSVASYLRKNSRTRKPWKSRKGWKPPTETQRLSRALRSQSRSCTPTPQGRAALSRLATDVIVLVIVPALADSRTQNVMCVGRKATSLPPAGQSQERSPDSSSHHTKGNSPSGNRRQLTRSRLKQQLKVPAVMSTLSSS